MGGGRFQVGGDSGCDILEAVDLFLGRYNHVPVIYELYISLYKIFIYLRYTNNIPTLVPTMYQTIYLYLLARLDLALMLPLPHLKLSVR